VNSVAILLTALAGFLAALLAWRKYGPEARKISVETVDINVKVAGDNVRIAGDLRDDAWEQWAKVRTELTALTERFDQYRIDTDARLAEQATQVRAARAGEAEAIRKANLYAAENKELRIRVDSLEAEVTALKADRAV
jgi:hypothetical protein